MSKSLIAGLLALGLAGCSSSGDSDLAGSGASDGATARALAVGTTMIATIQDSISSRTNRGGERVKAIISRNVVDDSGRVVIPGGAAVVLTIADLASPKTAGAADGVIALDVHSVAVGASMYEASASVGTVPHTLIGRAAAPTQRDVVVTPGTPITITLTQPLRISAK